jgi:NAD-dependent DNA ligase
MDPGFDSVPKILAMNLSDFLKVDGFKDKTASKLRDGIAAKMADANLVTLMSASNMFGRGFSEKKLELILEAYPQVLTEKISMNHKVAKIAAIKGMATKTAEAFVERIPAFVEFLQACGRDLISFSSAKSLSLLSSTEIQDHPLNGKTVILTGFRDEPLQAALKQLGCKVGSSVSSKTFAVIVKDGDVEETGKVLDAKRCQVPLVPLSVFRSKYL